MHMGGYDGWEMSTSMSRAFRGGRKLLDQARGVSPMLGIVAHLLAKRSDAVRSRVLPSLGTTGQGEAILA
jgi:hypothetical protein